MRLTMITSATKGYFGSQYLRVGAAVQPCDAAELTLRRPYSVCYLGPAVVEVPRPPLSSRLKCLIHYSSLFVMGRPAIFD